MLHSNDFKSFTLEVEVRELCCRDRGAPEWMMGEMKRK